MWTADRLSAWEPAAWPLHASWCDTVEPFWTSAAGKRLAAFVSGRLAAGATVYPPRPLRALELTPLPEVRVVVVGQDPYHGPGQAEGLAFSVAPGVRPPPSLRNIFQELQREYGGALASRGSLVHWARQGVLLLNTCLSVEDGCAASHTRQGWEELTAELIWACAKDPSPKVFMLWGAHAQGFADRVAGHGHLLLQANHPSPLSARRPPVPFIGCGHFAEANRWLQAQGRSPVHWLSEEDICAAC